MSFQVVQFLFLLAIVSLSSVLASSKPIGFSTAIHARFKFEAAANKNSIDKSTYSYYDQTLDHFSYTPWSYATFKQRYLINSDYWAAGDHNSRAPIFVVLGAESSITIQLGIFENHARQLKALLIYIEHRYYGESNPAGSMEVALRNASLRGYFTSAQALQDYAEIILHLKHKLNATKSPVIVAGASYGGMLAAWFRLKYPHASLGALASSAPILYFDNIIPQDCFFSVVTKAFRETSEKCYTIIRKSWFEIDKLADQPGGLLLLTKRFKLCSPLLNSADLKEYLKEIYTEIVQYNPPNPDDDAIKPICDSILNGFKNSSGDLLAGIYEGFVTVFGKKKCYRVGKFSNVPEETILGWDWQACTEMVMSIGQTLTDSMFPIAPFDLNNYIKTCNKRYNVPPRAHWITNYFGGHDIRTVLEGFGSNIIFSNGLKDPYRCGGVLNSISKSIVALNTNGSHCQDVDVGVDDPKWLIKQQEEEVKIMRGWIKKYDVKLIRPKTV